MTTKEYGVADDLNTKFARLSKQLEDHEKHCTAEFKAGADKFTQIMTGIESLGDKVDDCVKQVCELKESTAGVRKVYNETMGAISTGVRVQGFLLWCIKWGVIWTALVLFLRWLIQYEPPNPPL